MEVFELIISDWKEEEADVAFADIMQPSCYMLPLSLAATRNI